MLFRYTCLHQESAEFSHFTLIPQPSYPFSGTILPTLAQGASYPTSGALKLDMHKPPPQKKQQQKTKILILIFPFLQILNSGETKTPHTGALHRSWTS